MNITETCRISLRSTSRTTPSCSFVATGNGTYRRSIGSSSATGGDDGDGH